MSSGKTLRRGGEGVVRGCGLVLKGKWTLGGLGTNLEPPIHLMSMWGYLIGGADVTGQF